MTTNNDTENLETGAPTKMQKRITSIAAGAVIVLAGLMLFLTATGLFPHLTVKNSAVFIILFAIALILVFSAAVQKNSVALWLAVCFFIPGLITLLVNFTALTYFNLYPLYIAIPGLASLVTLILSRDFKLHLKIAALFCVVAALFFLHSFAVLKIGFILPILLVLLGAVVIVAALRPKHSEDDDE